MDNLSKEAMEARQAGMTYGKWKGLQHEKELEEARRQEEARQAKIREANLRRQRKKEEEELRELQARLEEQAKQEQPKPEQPKPEQPKPEQPKPEQQKPEQQKQERKRKKTEGFWEGRECPVCRGKVPRWKKKYCSDECWRKANQEQDRARKALQREMAKSMW